MPQLGDPDESALPTIPEQDLAEELTHLYIPLPGPKASEFTATPIGVGEPLSKQVTILTSDLAHLKALYEKERKQRQAAETHCAFAAFEIKRLKVKLNSKEKGKKRKGNHFQLGAGSKAIAMMEPDARAAREQARLEKEKKTQEQQDKDQRQRDKENADLDRRAGLITGEVKIEYSGSLKGMKKAELQDIAFLLGIKEFDTLINEHLRTKIKERLMIKQQTYRHDTRFTKLFLSLDRDLAASLANSRADPPPFTIASQPPLPSDSRSLQVDMFPDALSTAAVNLPYMSVPQQSEATSSRVTLDHSQSHLSSTPTYLFSSLHTPPPPHNVDPAYRF